MEKNKNTGEETHQAEPGVVGEKGKNMIRIEKTEDAEKYIRDGVLKIDGDILFAGDDVNIPAKILCKNIYSEKYPRNIYAYDIKARVINAWDINAGNIKARDINAGDINARDIIARDIKARDINARDIIARDINARDIIARDINAWGINAGDINARDIIARDINARDIIARDINAWGINAQKIQYYGFCIAYSSMKYENIEARRKKHICLVLDEKSD